jgi:acyl carrier protein
VTNDQRLQGAFRQGLALPASFDVTRAQSTSLRQWDSVAHLQLVVAIEDEFSVRLSPAEVIDLKSYPAAIAVLQRHGVWADA